MALMSNPDPMPVDVIRALGLDGALLDGALLDCVLLEELGEMTELMGLRPRVTLPNLSATSPQT
jgi:hypothetical protein